MRRHALLSFALVAAAPTPRRPVRVGALFREIGGRLGRGLRLHHGGAAAESRCACSRRRRGAPRHPGLPRAPQGRGRPPAARDAAPRRLARGPRRAAALPRRRAAAPHRDADDLEAAVLDCAAENASNFSSMYQDARAGRRTEVDALSGWVVDRGNAPESARLAAAVRALAPR